VSGGPETQAALVGAVAGGLAALAAREAALASPAAAEWVRLTIEPLRRAGREGYAPSTRERRRLAALGAAAALLGGWLLAGAVLAVPMAVAGPLLAAWALAGRRRRYRTAELSRVAAGLGVGEPTATALESWRRSMRSTRIDALAAALLSQRLAGGDLAGLLRRFAAGAAERNRVAEDARAATAQARFTGLLVVAMPSGGALLAELLGPGFLGHLLARPASALMLALSACLQLAGLAAIRRLARVAG